MDVFTAIRTRRSVGRPSQKPVDRELIEKLLEAAAQAPSHHNTFPWRFHVLTGQARVELGERLASALRRRQLEDGQDPGSKQSRALLKAEAAKPLRAPVLIAVSSHPSNAPGIVEREEHFACAAAVQNMLLEAQGLGLGVMWRTGEGSESSELKEWLGLSGRDQIVALLYVGWPVSDSSISPLNRRPWPELTQWRGP